MSQIFLSPFAMPELDRVVEQLCAPSSLEGVFHRPLHDAPMPSLDVLEEILSRLKIALFPGYFGMSNVRMESMRYHLSANLDSIFRKLAEQIRCGACFACAEYAQECRECERISREKALESLRAALDAALPDDVLMPFVENADLVLLLLLAPQETRHEDGVRRILALAEPWLRHLGLPGTRASEIPFGLSVKQYEIARLAAEGRTGPEVACRVGLGLNTVKTHLKTVYRKCGANNRPELRRLLHGEK